MQCIVEMPSFNFGMKISLTDKEKALYRITDDIAMINTVDFITPPVNFPTGLGRYRLKTQSRTPIRWAENILSAFSAAGVRTAVPVGEIVEGSPGIVVV